MKKIILIGSLLTSIPVFAACLIDGNTDACSIAEFQQVPMQPTYKSRPLINEFSGSPESRLRPAENQADKNILREFAPESSNFNYNANCQFGVCQKTGAPEIFNDKTQYKERNPY